MILLIHKESKQSQSTRFHLEQSIDEDSVQIRYLLITKDMRLSIKKVKITPNAFSDHFALGLFLSPEENKDQRGPGFGNLIIHC